MKKMLWIASVSLSLSAPALLAVEHQDAAQEDGGMHVEQMQEHMLRMHEQLHKIQDAEDPEEREKLRQEHREMMQENMKNMREHMGGKQGGGMMDGGESGQRMGEPGGNQ